MALVLDLDVFTNEKRELKLGGKTFNFEIIPFEITLRFYDLLPVIQKIDEHKNISAEDAGKIFDVFTDLLKLSDETVDLKWIKKNIDIKRFPLLVSFIFNMMFDIDLKKNEIQENPEGSLPKSS